MKLNQQLRIQLPRMAYKLSVRSANRSTLLKTVHSSGTYERSLQLDGGIYFLDHLTRMANEEESKTMQMTSHKKTSLTKCASYARNLSFARPAKHEITRLKSAGGCLQSTRNGLSKMSKRPSKRIKLAKRTRKRANEMLVLSRVISRRRQFQIRTTNRHRLGQDIIRAIRLNRQCNNICGYHKCRCALNPSRCSAHIVPAEVFRLQDWQICLTLCQIKDQCKE